MNQLKLVFKKKRDIWQNFCRKEAKQVALTEAVFDNYWKPHAAEAGLEPATLTNTKSFC